MSISPARTAAFDILLRIERERAFSSVLLPLFEERLSPVDRSLCHELVLGSLRRQISLDATITTLAGKRKTDTEVLVALRLGLFQLRHLDRVPPRAAINESVDLVKRARKTSASGFVNAILRRATRESLDPTYVDEMDRISVETSHPRWLIERWADRMGVVEAEQLAASNDRSPKLALRVIKGDPELDAFLRSAQPSEVVPGCYLLERSGPLVRQLAGENRIYIQDEASQMVAHAITGPNGGQFLDVCAAPGGKTGAFTATNTPALAVAGDIHSARVRLLRDNCHRQGVDVDIVQYDASKLPFAGASFDTVLVDAPCSGTGTIRHNPEIRYFLRPNDIDELSYKQRAILTEASKVVRRGGTLLYSTCSLEPEEGEMVAKAFLVEHPDFESIPPEVPQQFLTEDGFARTWPHRDDMDGFFIAAFRRV